MMIPPSTLEMVCAADYKTLVTKQFCQIKVFKYFKITMTGKMTIDSGKVRNRLWELLKIVSDTINCYMTAQDFQSQHKNNKDFFLTHINIRSLNKNFGKLEELLIQLGKCLI